MRLGDTEYRAAVHRWTQLYSRQARTFREQVEMEALHKRLDAAERAGVIERVTNDYAELRQVGDLGGCEIL